MFIENDCLMFLFFLVILFLILLIKKLVCFVFGKCCFIIEIFFGLVFRNYVSWLILLKRFLIVGMFLYEEDIIKLSICVWFGKWLDFLYMRIDNRFWFRYNICFIIVLFFEVLCI